jgi:hypothetical protein
MSPPPLKPLPLYLLTTTGLPRNHHFLLLLHSFTPYSAQIYQVSGNIQIGMYYAHKILSSAPEQEADFIGLERLGYVEVERCEGVREVVDSVEPPKKQFEGARRLYPGEKLRRCQEWVGEVVEKLRGEGILIDSECGDK